MAVVVLAVALLGAVACASTERRESARELPVGLASAGALLDGCTTGDDDGVVRARCQGDVVLSMLTRPVGAAEPRYREEAFALGGTSGARLAWDQIVVPTEGPSGLVERARLLAPLASTPVATLIGAVRSVGGRDVQELWCSSRDGAGDARCRDLVGAVLGTVPNDDVPPAVDRDAAVSPPARPGAPVMLFGRALSLPTSCTASTRPDGGDASCTDGASLSWRKLATMEEASETLVATLAALDFTEGAPYPCTVASEPGRCEDHGGAAAGLCYLDAAPVAVACFAVDAKTHSLCAAVLRPQ